MKIGLTGGIGSGKSTVAAMLAACGAVVVDTDAISRALTAAGGAALPALVAAFGADVQAADGSLDRDAMRARVFADPQAKRLLESILHPMIGGEARRLESQAGPSPIVFDVPLLTESSHWRQRVARILVVDCRETTQIERVMHRNGWPRETVERIVAQQATRERRRQIADAVIFNDGLTLQGLQREVELLWPAWISSPGLASISA